MLDEVIKNQRYSFHEGFDSWQDSIRAACQPLIEEGAIESAYPEYIIENVNEFGPYIVIAPDICIPHAQEGKGVNETAICFMRTKVPVNFGPAAEYEARIFFVLASTDNEKHLANLSSLVTLLSDESVVDAFIQANSVADLEKIMEIEGEYLGTIN